MKNVAFSSNNHKLNIHYIYLALFFMQLLMKHIDVIVLNSSSFGVDIFCK